MTILLCSKGPLVDSPHKELRQPDREPYRSKPARKLSDFARLVFFAREIAATDNSIGDPPLDFGHS
jgi:hypothetical protein